MLQKASRWPHSQGKKHPESSTLKCVADMHSCQAWCSEFGYLVVESANKLRLKAAVFGVQIEDDMQGKLKTNPRKRKWLAFWWEYSSSGTLVVLIVIQIAVMLFLQAFKNITSEGSPSCHMQTDCSMFRKGQGKLCMLLIEAVEWHV